MTREVPILYDISPAATAGTSLGSLAGPASTAMAVAVSPTASAARARARARRAGPTSFFLRVRT